MLQVSSSDGVEVAVHRFGGPEGAPPVLLSHATGFHAHCYRPIADGLVSSFQVFALDHRGHRATPAPDGWAVDWRRFGDDCIAVCDAIAPSGGIVGIGHSMGGAALLMAAHRRPDLFRRLVLFEPIAVPPDAPVVDMESHPLVVGARRRRRRFESVDDAIDNFRAKPPLSLMRDDVLRCYVEHGFRPDDDERPGVELICRPEIEAGIFLTSHLNGVWELLAEVQVPTDVVSGYVADDQPSARCAELAAALPAGRAIRWDHQSHLGPFSHPDELAAHVVAICR
ncbi:MAG: alpha/beta fold hydrolase [Ilumatobacteraceae bacterium]